MPTATINLDVQELPDADVWFANAAAWNNYWNAVSGVVTLDASATTLYNPSAYDNTIQPYVLNVDGVDHILVTKAMFDSLVNMVTVLDASYQNLRTELKDAGYIDNAQ